MKLLKKLFIFLILTMPVFSVGDEFDSLIDDSPFDEVSESGNSEVAGESIQPVPAINYELHGIFISDEEKLFNIYLSSSQKYVWVKEGETISGITVKSYDDTSKTLHFTSAVDGRVHSIVLQGVPTDIGALGVVMQNE
ncbi:MAG: hypothetical protein LBI56_00780 [Puniceicoccales bacterium]|jgi:hypothetical protein|nr:hypothetical protein [Puniceicoccales bacterium]